MDTSTIPMLGYRQAIALMRKIFDTETLDVAVFWNRGWGDAPLDITIIKDGDGQAPVAQLAPDTYARLLQDGVIAPDNLRTFKGRKNHQYAGHGWLKACRLGQRMLGVARIYPALGPAQKAAVKRAVQRYAEGTPVPKRWKGVPGGALYRARFARAGITIDFDWSAYGGRYVSDILCPEAAPAAGPAT